MDAVIHGSGSLIFVAAVPNERREAIRKGAHIRRATLLHRQGKIIPLSQRSVDSIAHEDDPRQFTYKHGPRSLTRPHGTPEMEGDVGYPEHFCEDCKDTHSVEEGEGPRAAT